MSDEDIESGARWDEGIAKQLDETDFGIVCVTRANQAGPWLIFEAGALAKSVEKGRVVPLFIELLPSDLTGPLTAFQGRQLDEDGVRRLVNDLNEAAEKKISKERLDGIFKRMWPDLASAVSDALIDGCLIDGCLLAAGPPFTGAFFKESSAHHIGE
jgi:hypothetical protein